MNKLEDPNRRRILQTLSKILGHPVNRVVRTPWMGRESFGLEFEGRTARLRGTGLTSSQRFCAVLREEAGIQVDALVVRTNFARIKYFVKAAAIPQQKWDRMAVRRAAHGRIVWAGVLMSSSVHLRADGRIVAA